MTINYSGDEFYCRYLDSRYRFPNYLKRSFGIQKLPYSLTLLDLLPGDVFSPDLFTALPEEFFFAWENYSCIPKKFSDDLPRKLADAVDYDIYIHSRLEQAEDCHHPYDYELKESFVRQFSSPVPEQIVKIRHPNGSYLYPYAAYFAYWRGYPLFEAVDSCRGIESFLPKEAGIAIFKKHLSQRNEDWNEHYRDTFDRLSFYRTFTARNAFSKHKIEGIETYLLHYTHASQEILEEDMEKLLILFQNWKWKIERYGKCHYSTSLELLRKDIYLLLQWLSNLTGSAEKFFERWTNHGAVVQRWAELKEVINDEAFAFEQTFKLYLPAYSKDITKWLKNIDIDAAYARLAAINSFTPWVRAFHDLHESINIQKKPIDFKHTRIIDRLIVITIRTEIVIRSLYQKRYVKKEPYDLKELFLKLNTGIFQAVYENWNITQLRYTPDDVFEKIDALIDNHVVGKKWSNDQKYFFRAILKFIAARNYFAHHSYLDESMDTRGELAGSVLEACLHSLLFVEDFLSKQ